jgi:uncharacterized protein
MTTDIRSTTARLSSPRRVALLVLVGQLIVVGVGALIAAALLPNSDGTTRSLVAAVLLLLFSVVVARTVAVRNGGWRALGLIGRTEWRDTKLLAVPALLSLIPLLGGLRSIEGSALAVLVVGELITGFMEELLWRGAVQRILAPIGIAKAVWVGSVLFGAAHLANVLFRGSVALVVAQAFGAFCFGVGYAALRWRTKTIWPLMVTHSTTDLFAAIGGLPKIPILVGQDVVLLALGAYLIHRGHTSERS